MAGNVFELCNDWYDENYYSISTSSNPTGPSYGTERVMRGGSWISFGDLFGGSVCNTTVRGACEPKMKDDWFGFRVAR